MLEIVFAIYLFKHSRNLEEIHAETLARISNEFDNLVKDSELLHEVAKRGEEMGDFANDEGN